MKKIFVIVLSIMVVTAASAQVKGGGHYWGGGRYYHAHTRVIVGVGAGYYSPFYYPYYPYYPYGGYPVRPSGLQLKIEDIKADYKDRIYSVRHDKSMSKSERREMIHQLKSDRELAIHDAERNYHRSYDNNQGS